MVKNSKKVNGKIEKIGVKIEKNSNKLDSKKVEV